MSDGYTVPLTQPVPGQAPLPVPETSVTQVITPDVLTTLVPPAAQVPTVPPIPDGATTSVLPGFPDAATTGVLPVPPAAVNPAGPANPPPQGSAPDGGPTSSGPAPDAGPVGVPQAPAPGSVPGGGPAPDGGVGASTPGSVPGGGPAPDGGVGAAAPVPGGGAPNPGSAPDGGSAQPGPASGGPAPDGGAAGPVPAKDGASGPGTDHPATQVTKPGAPGTDHAKADAEAAAARQQKLDLDKAAIQNLLKLISSARGLVDTVHTKARDSLDVQLQFGKNWVGEAISRRLHQVAVGNDTSAVWVIGEFMQVLIDVEQTIQKAARRLEEADDDAADAFNAAGEVKGS